MTRLCYVVVVVALVSDPLFGHGTAFDPVSRVRRIYDSNPENPSFQLARDAVALDGTEAYYNWNEVSRNIPAAVQAGLPPGFDYSPWVPDGQIASGGRTDSSLGFTYLGLDQVSADWPTTAVDAGETLAIDFHATAPHNPSVWDVWMTATTWEPTMALTWDQMEFLGRPQATLVGNSYLFDVDIPSNRSGHHVLWIAWQRDDPVGEVFFSASDILVSNQSPNGDFNADGIWDCADVDLLSQQIAMGSNDLAFDMNGDQMLTAADILGESLGWLAVAGNQNASQTGGNPYLPADANLDGAVDGQDFIAWNNHKFAAAAWCSGDFNVDGTADGQDFIVWNEHKFQSVDGVVVPEPTALWSIVVSVLVGLRWRRMAKTCAIQPLVRKRGDRYPALVVEEPGLSRIFIHP